MITTGNPILGSGDIFVKSLVANLLSMCASYLHAYELWVLGIIPRIRSVAS